MEPHHLDYLDVSPGPSSDTGETVLIGEGIIKKWTGEIEGQRGKRCVAVGSERGKIWSCYLV